MVTFGLTILAVFAAWNFVLPWLPDTWAPGYPLIVVGLAYGSTSVPHPVLVAAAVAGAVGVLYTVVSRLGANAPSVVLPRLPQRRPRESGLRGVGSRVPDLP